MLAVAFCPELVALIAGPANSPPNRTSCTRRPRGTIGVLPVLLLRPRPAHVRVHADMLLELLKGVVGGLRHTLEPVGVEVRVGDMAVREEGGRRNSMVWRKPVKRIRQHVV